MIWLSLVSAGLAIALLVVWIRLTTPWRSIEAMIARIAAGEKPRTFLIGGGAQPRRVALMLENLFQRQSELERKLAERSAGAETIFTALHDGLLVVDPRRRVTLVNRSLEQTFGKAEGIMGAPVLEWIRDPQLDQLIGQALREPGPQRGELSVAESAVGGRRRIQLSAVAMKNERGEVTGVVILFHDITQLVEADEIRRDFVANVSHELRTPLSILRGYIETLIEDPEITREESVRMLEVMNRHSKRLGMLVDDLLTLAQLESKNPNLQLTDVRLTELFAAIVRDWGRRFAEKKLSIDVRIPSDLPALRADEVRLQEVLYNLLDNALKYTPVAGRIVLQAERRGNDVAISVSDSGIGIPEADLPRVFERFYRADKARSRELGGTGLGLSIVKHIAQMHGGRVEAESTLGRGTTIRVFMPLARPISEPTPELISVTESLQ